MVIQLVEVFRVLVRSLLGIVAKGIPGAMGQRSGPCGCPVLAGGNSSYPVRHVPTRFTFLCPRGREAAPPPPPHSASMDFSHMAAAFSAAPSAPQWWAAYTRGRH